MRARGIFWVWTALGLCAVTVFGAMTWLTRNVLAAERERATARHERALAEARADLEERTRLALWRMDALGAAVVLRENLHPAAHYELLTQSPFLTSSDPEVFLHFQIQQGGGLASPELDEHNAKEAGVDAKIIEERKERMKHLRVLLSANPLPGDEWTQLNCAALHGETTWNSVPKDAPKEQERNRQLRDTISGDELRQQAAYQSYNNTGEYAKRAKAVAKNLDQATDNYTRNQQQEIQLAQPQAPGGMIPSTASTDITPMRCVWLGGELLLLRQVSKRSPAMTKAVQGVWLNPKALKEQLLAEVADLLPRAALTPTEEAKNPLALVSFPFLLERNEAAVAPLVEAARIGAPLIIGWVAVLLAVLATSLLVRGVMRLSERRASFVSAVTHELRTPLTTFRLYSDMLETGAVKEEKRGHYLRVLSREADRLSHLVENVLAFSRIERGNARSNVRDADAAELLGGMRERFESRLATAGLALEMEIPSGVRVRADIAAVEHILFNLIDNAAKYAAAGDPPVVAISAKQAGRFVEITVRDHGPGIAAPERGRIFQAFHKSAREAAETQPGVGLGLALSRRLARAAGGDLKCASSASGACFILSLPSLPPG